MKSDFTITMLSGDDGVKMEIRDKASRVIFFRCKLTPEQFCQAMGRRGDTQVEEASVHQLDKVGKQKEQETLRFRMPDFNFMTRKEVAHREALRICPEGWEPSNYYGSQGSFYVVDGEEYATTIISRWVDRID